MYKKVELKDGFVGMEREVAENWKKKETETSVSFFVCYMRL